MIGFNPVGALASVTKGSRNCSEGQERAALLWPASTFEATCEYELLQCLMQVCNVTGKFSYLGRNLLVFCHKSLAIWGFPFHLDIHAEILSTS